MTKQQLQEALEKEKAEIYNARKAKLSKKSMDYIYRGWTPPANELTKQEE